MKILTSGVKRGGPNSRSAFTLIEMIGVLAVIAILASMLIPRVFEAINSARVNSTAVACETIKTAAADHFGKYGQFDLAFGQTNVFAGSATTVSGYDTLVLMPEGLLDKPFSARIAGGDPSTNSVVQLVKGTGTGAIGNGGVGYKLDGVNIATAANTTFLLEAVMFNVSQADAKDLNDRIDGLALGAQQPGQSDTSGRVEYNVGSGSGPVTVYVYLTHR
jgi:prepilin-type N-terminal cleavage/methylation domain-containing protein